MTGANWRVVLVALAAGVGACGEADPTSVPGQTTWDIDVDVTQMDFRYCWQGTRPIVYRFTVVAGSDTLGFIGTPAFPAESGAWVPGSYLYRRFDPLSTAVSLPNGESPTLNISFEAGDWGPGLLNPLFVGQKDVARVTSGEFGGRRSASLAIGKQAAGACTWLHSFVSVTTKARP